MESMPTPLVSSEWLNNNFDDPDIIILDASAKDNKTGLIVDFEEVQIKGSRAFDLKNAFSDKESNFPNTLQGAEVFEEACRKLGINKNSKIVVYDNLGIYNSPRAWWMFKMMGHNKVSVLDGGLPDWIRQGYEVEPLGIGEYAPGDFKAAYQPELFRSTKDLVDNLEDKNELVIDARSAGRFDGTAPEPRKGLQSGHIPGSLNIPFQKVLDHGKYKSKAELLEIFNDLKLGDQPLIFTCGSGITACILYLAGELSIANPKAVFDGSWTEWALSGLPIENKL
ncbi:MAG: thiosulfate/3-mercaptopyruvate sulfurtransferase [Saprospiraceae bacterium]|jgi:thiosulfate/3-mercaptopyruvate sulfurtransferase